MRFEKAYQRITPWWRPISASFITIESFSIQTSILGFDVDCKHGRLRPDGRLTVRPDFVFGASGPTWDTPSSRKGSCFHDLLYYMARKGHFQGKRSKQVKELADTLLFFLLIEDGMWEWRAEAWYSAVSKFGDKYWEG